MATAGKHAARRMMTQRRHCLSSKATTGGRCLKCFAGCTAEAICGIINITTRRLVSAETREIGSAKHCGATYDYHDASGKVVFQVVRYEPKDFRQRKPDATAPDGWTWNTKGVEKVLFRLPEILRDVQSGKFIFVCEGEKDALAMAERGLSATCNPGGAGKWQDSFTETLRGADVVIIADKDKAGRDHAQLVAGKLHGVAKSVRVHGIAGRERQAGKRRRRFFRRWRHG
jgi:DNA primase